MFAEDRDFGEGQMARMATWSHGYRFKQTVAAKKRAKE